MLLEWFALIGSLGVVVALIVLGLLSYRLGMMTHAQPHYLGFFICAGFIGISVLLRAFDLLIHFSVQPNVDPLLWVIARDGLPAAAATLGVYLAWRYWSWLLAERD